jgi:hypothetical protein
MAEAEKTSSAREPTTTDKSASKTYEKRIDVSLLQDVSLWASISLTRLLARTGGMVRAIGARLRGRPRDYDYDAIRGVAETLIGERGLDRSLDALCRRVRNGCRNNRPRIRTPRSRRQMRIILQPIWDAARAGNL